MSPVPGGIDGLTQTHPRTCPRMGWARGRGASLIGAESEPGGGEKAGPAGVWWVWAEKNPAPRRKEPEESRELSAEEQVKFVEVKWYSARRKNYRSRREVLVGWKMALQLLLDNFGKKI